MTSVSGATAELTRARHAEGMAAYCREGLRIADEIGNRGPVRFDADGRLHPDILDAYRKHGFYIFEGVLLAPRRSTSSAATPGRCWGGRRSARREGRREGPPRVRRRCAPRALR